MAIDFVSFPMKNGDFPMINGDFPMKNGGSFQFVLCKRLPGRVLTKVDFPAMELMTGGVGYVKYPTVPWEQNLKQS